MLNYAVRALLIAVAFSGVSGSAALAAQAAPCVKGSLECPVALKALQSRPTLLQGRLSRARNSVSYKFTAKRGDVLTWSYRGPAANIVVQYSDGDADGPGLTSPYTLAKRGPYIFSLAANKMSENIYGRFSLRLGVQPGR